MTDMKSLQKINEKLKEELKEKIVELEEYKCKYEYLVISIQFCKS